MNRLIALLVGLGTIAFFTFFANSIPQAAKQFDEGVTVEAGISGEEMAALGEQIFAGKGGCSTCHRVGSIGARAPDLAGVGSRAAERVEEADYTGAAANAEGYLRESLEGPCTYVVEGYDCIMPVINRPPVNLDETEMALVIAYLQSLGGEITVTLPGEDLPGQVASSSVTPEPAPTTPQGIVDVMACGLCHTISGLENAAGVIGPDLTAMGDRAAASIGSQDYTGRAGTVQEYIRESILTPNTYLAQDCPTSEGGTAPCRASIMPPNFGERLTAQQMEVLVDFLSSLQEP
ncbi:MAG: c-type cytochrome [Chloroflexi bacterium]|nr:c-type cytochrome [Chloroflexota bacterium]